MASVAHDYQYSVQVKSRFDPLASEDLNSEDPDLLLKKIQSRRNEHKATPSTLKEDKSSSKSGTGVKKVTAEPVPEVAHPEAVSQANRVQSKVGRGGRVADVSGDDTQLAPKSETWEARGRGRGGFARTRPAHGATREFDRHSGSDKTGIKPVIKKDGHGTGNWGTIEDELEVAMAPEAPVDEHLVDVIPEEAKTEKTAEQVEEEVKTLTLKEYKEQLKVSKAKVALSSKETRKANDGKDVFSNMVASNKPKPVQTTVVDVLEEEKKEQDTKPVFFEISRGKPMARVRPSGPNAYGRGRGGAQADRTEHDGEHVERPIDRPVRGSDRIGFNSERAGGRGGVRGVGRGFNADRVGGRGGSNSERAAGRGGFNSERAAGRGGFNAERSSGRGGFNAERISGRGGFNAERISGRGGLNSERAGGRGAFNLERGARRGGFNPERGGGRGPFNAERDAGRGSVNIEGAGEIEHADREAGHSERGRGFGNTERGRGGGRGDRPSFRGGEHFERGGRGSGFRGGRGAFEQREPEHRGHFVSQAPVMDSDVDFPVLK